MSPRRVVVIGGGVAGLATAALLARDGREVVLLEAHDDVGGRAGAWQAAGFEFETGPSWLLMRTVFDRFYRRLGTTTAAELAPERLDPAYRVFFEDHAAALTVPGDRDGAAALFEAVEPGAGRALERYLDSARTAAELAERYFLYNPYSRPRELLHGEVLRAAPRLARLLGCSLDSFAGRHVGDERLRKILGFPAVFLGTSPYRAPAMYHLMSHFDLSEGVFYPRGGFRAVVSSLCRLALRHGATVRTGARAEQILVQSGRAAGVAWCGADGGRHVERADAVVSAADLHHTETALLAPEHRSFSPRWWHRRESGPGAVLLLAGVVGSLDRLAHHNLFFAADWERNFAAIFGPQPRVPQPASLYVCRPSATDPYVAPAGHENLFLLVPVPAEPGLGAGGVGGAGDAGVEAVADMALAQVGRWAGIPGLAERVVVRRTLGPADFARDFSSWRGGALGPAHTLRQSALLRAGNVSRRVANLFYAGAGVTPGIGVPMCLISAELVLKRMRGDHSAAPWREAPSEDGAAAKEESAAEGKAA